MKTKINSLKDFVAKDAQIIIECQNNLNVLGITFMGGVYVVSWHNRVNNRYKHYVFNDLQSSYDLYNVIMSLQF